MPCLTDLPLEILLPILDHLSRISLATFLTSQAACKTFRLLAQDILSRPQEPTWHAWLGLPGEDCEDLFQTLAHPFLLPRFNPLFLSASCFTREERDSVRWFLTLNGDTTRPFRRLPWARDALSREVYLRPGASWQSLGVTFGLGPSITHVAIVKSYASEALSEDGRDHVQYLQVGGLPGPGFLTVGLLYNLLLCGGAVGDGRAVTFGRETGSWALLLGRRLRSYDLLLEYECFIPVDEDLVDMGPDAAQSAILYVRGGTVEGGDRNRRFAELEGDDVDWVPELLEDVPRFQLTSG